MHGETIIARSVSAARIPDKHGNRWQYHSRSDRHSKVACWSILFDLLQSCELLRSHVVAGKVGFGINHEMRDFKQDRKKNLDLVLCAAQDLSDSSFVDYAESCGVVLDAAQRSVLQQMPPLRRASVANVLVALEAKACMTEHVKALPRLHDELSSSHLTIHGDTSRAIAAGFVMINCGPTFVSPDRNRKHLRGANAEVTSHRQPAVAQRTIEAVLKLPRRSDEQGVGFDAVGITMIQCANDGSSVELDPSSNADVLGQFHYDAFVRRIAHLYATKFSAL